MSDKGKKEAGEAVGGGAEEEKEKEEEEVVVVAELIEEEVEEVEGEKEGEEKGFDCREAAIQEMVRLSPENASDREDLEKIYDSYEKKLSGTPFEGPKSIQKEINQQEDSLKKSKEELTKLEADFLDKNCTGMATHVENNHFRFSSKSDGSNEAVDKVQEFYAIVEQKKEELEKDNGGESKNGETKHERFEREKENQKKAFELARKENEELYKEYEWNIENTQNDIEKEFDKAIVLSQNIEDKQNNLDTTKKEAGKFFARGMIDHLKEKGAAIFTDEVGEIRSSNSEAQTKAKKLNVIFEKKKDNLKADEGFENGVVKGARELDKKRKAEKKERKAKLKKDRSYVVPKYLSKQLKESLKKRSADVQDGARRFGNFVKTGWESLTTTVNKKLEIAEKFVNERIKDALDITKSITQKVTDFKKNIKQKVTDTARGVADKVKKTQNENRLAVLNGVEGSGGIFGRKAQKGLIKEKQEEINKAIDNLFKPESYHSGLFSGSKKKIIEPFLKILQRGLGNEGKLNKEESVETYLKRFNKNVEELKKDDRYKSSFTDGGASNKTLKADVGSFAGRLDKIVKLENEKKTLENEKKTLVENERISLKFGKSVGEIEKIQKQRKSNKLKQPDLEKKALSGLSDMFGSTSSSPSSSSPSTNPPSTTPPPPAAASKAPPASSPASSPTSAFASVSASASASQPNPENKVEVEDKYNDKFQVFINYEASKKLSENKSKESYEKLKEWFMQANNEENLKKLSEVLESNNNITKIKFVKAGDNGGKELCILKGNDLTNMREAINKKQKEVEEAKAVAASKAPPLLPTTPKPSLPSTLSLPSSSPSMSSSLSSSASVSVPAGASVSSSSSTLSSVPSSSPSPTTAHSVGAAALAATASVAGASKPGKYTIDNSTSSNKFGNSTIKHIKDGDRVILNSGDLAVVDKKRGAGHWNNGRWEKSVGNDGVLQ
ncbi:hypothetical protein FACS1894152_5340 [Bacilli bacterium]|nr:hypothetical protein FACS1894152_5340 [Bacilli bacterium]